MRDLARKKGCLLKKYFGGVVVGKVSQSGVAVFCERV